MSAKALTVVRLREVLRYDEKTGHFTWLVNSGPAHVGQIAGSATQHGYITICVDRQRYYAHRLAWFYMTGNWPTDQVDHVDGVGSNNAFANLRECSNSENCQNLGRRRSNTSGITGVHWNASRRKWVAQIRMNGKITPLGRYQSKEEAHAAYLAAKRSSHKFQPVPREMAP